MPALIPSWRVMLCQEAPDARRRAIFAVSIIKSRATPWPIWVLGGGPRARIDSWASVKLTVSRFTRVSGVLRIYVTNQRQSKDRLELEARP